jgi:Arc/MetJ family transcription regulator
MCNASHMATNLAIDPELLEKALEVSGERTKTAAVTKALQEFVARRQQRALLGLFGALDWNRDFGYKKERSR